MKNQHYRDAIRQKNALKKKRRNQKRIAKGYNYFDKQISEAKHDPEKFGLFAKMFPGLFKQGPIKEPEPLPKEQTQRKVI